MDMPDADSQPPALLAEDINRDFGVPWFMRYDYRNDARYRVLSAGVKSAADRFMRDGFIVFPNAIDPGYADAVVADFRSFCSRHADYFDPFRDQSGHLQRIINLHLVMPRLVELFSLATDVLALQDALFAAPASIYTTLYFERGSAQSVHRDTPYFATRPEYTYFGTWFALEDADQGNGCLEVIPGGHLVKEVDRRAFATRVAGDAEIGSINTVLFDTYQQDVHSACREAGLSSIAVPLKKGDVLIWHPQLPHGGGQIADRTRSRNSIVFHTVPEGVPVYQAYAFFDPSSRLPGTAPWPMERLHGRAFAAHDTIDVMHKSPRSRLSFS
ncbi:MAG: hypothetical protein EBZ59_08630 [Planctomycetia bacterium]|nr:hypothetical protein [Planctomycetia bacterium]